MSVLKDILNLLSGPTGGMAYHLILLFCVWAIVGLSLSRLSHPEHSRISQRILLAGSLLSLCRFLPIVVALLDRQDGVSLVRLGPPLERFVDTVSTLLICSAFVLPRQKKTLNRVLVAILGLLTLGLYLVAAFQWTTILSALPAALYNRAVQRWVWELWQLVLLVPAFVYVLVGPAEEREALGAALSTLIVAHLMQALFPVPSQIPHAAAWVRLGNLVAFPLLGVSTYLLIFHRFETEAQELQVVNQQSLTQITNLISLLEANTRLSRSLDLNNVLKSAALVIAQELQSDLCALALPPADAGPSHGTEPTELELAVVYDTPDVFFEAIRFHLQDYPVIQHAVAHGRPAILGSRGPSGYDVSTSPQEAAAIFELLQSELSGPLIVQPITAPPSETGTGDAQAIGAMLVCRTDPRHTFTIDQAHKSESLAAYLGPAIENARRYSHAQARIEQLANSRQTLETENVRTRTDLENRLQKSEEQAAAYMQRLYEAERGEQQAQKDAHQVHREMARLRQESQQELAQAKSELRRGIQHATRLTQRIAELDAERIRLTSLVETLQMERDTQQLRLAMTNHDQPQTAADGQSGRITRQLHAPSAETDVAPVPDTSVQDALLGALEQPTASLLHDTELLANGSTSTLGGQQRALLNQVRANVERLGFVLANLAILRDIDASTLTPKPAPTHIARLIERALASARFRLEERRLRTRLAIGAVPIVRVDPHILQRILDNLLDELCRTAQEGTTIGIQASIERQADPAATEPLLLHITLSGSFPSASPGASDGSDTSDTGAVAGELAQSLVLAHGGRVWRESQPDAGASVHTTIPVASAPRKQAAP